METHAASRRSLHNLNVISSSKSRSTLFAVLSVDRLVNKANRNDSWHKEIKSKTFLQSATAKECFGFSVVVVIFLSLM